MIAIATLLLVLTISLLVTRVATVILTASESERVVDNPLRRRVIMTLMLLGIAGIVASASSMILGFRSGGIGHQGWRLLELGCGLLALVYVSRSRWVDRRLHELALRDEGAAVLGVTQRSGRYLGAPTGDTLLRSRRHPRHLRPRRAAARAGRPAVRAGRRPGPRRRGRPAEADRAGAVRDREEPGRGLTHSQARYDVSFQPRT